MHYFSLDTPLHSFSPSKDGDTSRGNRGGDRAHLLIFFVPSKIFSHYPLTLQQDGDFKMGLVD
ncbi:MAG: hypothetical protein IGS49_20980 [Chlorogloeopsis fritschii C42_A2020_084]|uniref:hypothetical protein n=1 Tax=Chlorogloeopsis fritschii TaxID=1124 RepID=UPI0019E7B37D|nr:hypothetical protein [Chlorogloeopsis fritschii]MBF2007852.1 hypothetical protein [Chlorogloeopsis fritschii C42_A2020_084]